jgi:hypothetical protein
MTPKMLAMTEATLLIKKIPSDLKDWLAAEALRNGAGKPARDSQAIAGILQTMHSLPVLDARPMNEALYDASGLPK